ncbi:hypothetical protein H0A66_17200 [Alcaligenaceae bacterium]|nr:hypothetical protein [Alcaligenaceae bacterium]
MLKATLISAALGLALASPMWAQSANLTTSPPGEGYEQVSKLVKLPDFLPGMGQLFVKPATLPAGPFLAYDRHGKLVSSIYMIPLKDLNDHKTFDNLATGPHKVDHVTFMYNAGHPGVEVPHYHVILWYVSAKEAAALK